MQIYPGQAYDHDLAANAVEFLQTRDPSIFPFTRDFDEERMRGGCRVDVERRVGRLDLEQVLAVGERADGERRRAGGERVQRRRV